jgi:hypothetical protein
MKIKILALLAAFALIGVFAAAASAGGKTETKVTIKGDNGDYYGYVKSKKDKCANGREVIVYKLKGNGYDPKNDKEIGRDIAQANNDGYMWAIGNSGAKKGDFYAFVKKDGKCAKAFSKVISR